MPVSTRESNKRSPRPPVASPEANPGLLLMLDSNAALCTLISTWPNAYRDGVKKDVQIGLWAKLTGLRVIEVEEAWVQLFDNGFIRPDGTVDPYAARYVGAKAMGKLPASVRTQPQAKHENKPEGGQ